MPRLGRTILPDYPHHVVQRGHNRQVVFTEPGDFEWYLEILIRENRHILLFLGFLDRHSRPLPGVSEAGVGVKV